VIKFVSDLWQIDGFQSGNDIRIDRPVNTRTAISWGVLSLCFFYYYYEIMYMVNPSSVLTTRLSIYSTITLLTNLDDVLSCQ